MNDKDLGALVNKEFYEKEIKEFNDEKEKLINEITLQIIKG